MHVYKNGAKQYGNIEPSLDDIKLTRSITKRTNNLDNENLNSCK